MIKREEIKWDVVARYLAGESSHEETAEAESWISQSEENRQEFDKIRQTWQSLTMAGDLEKIDIEGSLKKVKSKLSFKPVKDLNSWKFYTRIAASILILLSIGLGIYFYSGKNTELITGMNENRELTLQDGSKVYLNGNTRFLFPEKFTGNQRKVYLTGEAFFDVTPDKSKPFTILTDNSVITVLGTSFNVKEYENSEHSIITVKSGVVEIEKKSFLNTGTNSLILEKGSQGFIPKSGNEITKQNVKNENYLAWRTKKIKFSASTLYEVKDILESVYLVNIVFNDPTIGNMKLTADFDNDNIHTVIGVINKTFAINSRFYNNEVIFSFE